MNGMTKKIGLNSFWLKMIAITTMLIDHVGSGAASAISDFENHRKDCFPDFLLSSGGRVYAYT